MIFHENRLLADHSQEIPYLIFFSKIGKDVKNLSSAAVVIGAKRVKAGTKFENVVCCNIFDGALRVYFLYSNCCFCCGE